MRFMRNRSSGRKARRDVMIDGGWDEPGCARQGKEFEYSI